MKDVYKTLEELKAYVESHPELSICDAEGELFVYWNTTDEIINENRKDKSYCIAIYRNIFDTLKFRRNKAFNDDFFNLWNRYVETNKQKFFYIFADGVTITTDKIKIEGWDNNVNENESKYDYSKDGLWFPIASSHNKTGTSSREMYKKNKFKAGDKVRVKGTKSILTIKEPLYSDNETYYFVKERVCAIRENQLSLIK